MKKPLKAALLSGLVFPGIGHLMLKKFLAAALFAGVAAIALYYLVANMLIRAQQITEKIQSGEIPADSAAIMQQLLQQSSGPEAQQMSYATTALLLSWLAGIVDAYRVGRQQSESETEAGS